MSCTECWASSPADLQHCVAHLTSDELEVYGERLGAGEPILAEGATITASRPDELADYLPFDGDHRVLSSDFANATFQDGLYGEYERWRNLSAVGARFEGDVKLLDGSAEGTIDLSQATFDGDVDIEAAGGAVWYFNESTFHGDVRLKIKAEALHLSSTTCAADVRIDECQANVATGPERVGGDLVILRSALANLALRGRVEGRFSLWRLVCRDLLGIEYLTAESRADLEEIVVSAAMVRECSVRGTFRCVATARSLNFARCRFERPAELRVQADELSLQGVSFDEQTLIAGQLQGDEWTGRRRAIDPDSRPAKFLEPAAYAALGGRWPAGPTSVTRIDATRVDKVHLEDIDLSICVLRDALGLEALRLGRGCRLPKSPRPFGRRVVLADEIIWRAAPVRIPRPLWASMHPVEWPPTRRAAAWRALWETLALGRSETDAPVDYPLRDRRRSRETAAGPVADAYRGLRAGLEDRKDQPGASDFYFGEMQMRESARLAGWPAIAAYRVTSGYGTRPGRAVLCLLGLILILGVLFSAWGFDPGHERGLPEAGLFAALAAGNALTRDDLQHLSDAGDVFRLVGRILGPVTLALLAFSLRSRVKR